MFDNLKKVLDTYHNIIFRQQGVEVKYFDFINIDYEYIEKNRLNLIGSVIFSSDKYGFINKNYDFVKELKSEINLYYSNKYNKEKDYFLNIISGDLLHHLYLPSHKDLGSNISIGNIQRMGLPLFNGGPHGGYMSIDKHLIRCLPGKLVGISKDTYGEPKYRLSLQTREQHNQKKQSNFKYLHKSSLINKLHVGMDNVKRKKIT